MFEIQNKYVKNGEKISISYDDMVTMQMNIDFMHIQAEALLRHENIKPGNIKMGAEGKPILEGAYLMYMQTIAAQLNHDRALYILKLIDPSFNEEKLNNIYRENPGWIPEFIFNFNNDSKFNKQNIDEEEDISKVDDIKKPLRKTSKK